MTVKLKALPTGKVQKAVGAMSAACSIHTEQLSQQFD